MSMGCQALATAWLIAPVRLSHIGGGIAVAPLGPVHRLPDVPLAEPGATAVAEGQLPVIFCRRGPDGVAVCEPGRRAGELRPGVELVVGVRVAIDVDVL